MEQKQPTERLVTLKKASELTGVEYRQILEGARLGLFPVYSIHKSRKMIFVSEFLSFVRSTVSKGGNHV